MSEAIKKVGIITSGGDCQAMNAAVRAVVLAARKYDIEVVGISDAYYGMTHNRPGDFRTLNAKDVENIVNRGGTILNSARFEEFGDDPEGYSKIMGKNLKANGIGALVVIGGDGSFRGGLDILKYTGIPCIGIPATIDNDIVSTEYTLGFDTALRNTMAMCDALRDTCNSHKRCNIVEVMGRKAGQIALHTAIACGASAVAIPEADFNEDEVIEKMIKARHDGKRSFLIVCAEGAENKALTEDMKKAAIDKAVDDYKNGNIDAKALTKTAFNNYKAEFGEQLVGKIQDRSREAFKKYYEEEKNEDFKGEFIETKFCRFAHIARGGIPTSKDRVIAGQFGERVMKLVSEGKFNRVVCVHDGLVTDMDMVEAISVDSFYRKFAKTGSYDKAVYDAMTPVQKKMFEYRLAVAERLVQTAKSLSEV